MLSTLRVLPRMIGITATENLMKPANGIQLKKCLNRNFHKCRTLSQRTNVLPVFEDFPQIDVPEYKEQPEEATIFRGMETDFPCLTRK